MLGAAVRAPSRCRPGAEEIGDTTGRVSFGRNPHVAKAQAAEQRAQAAGDEHTASRAYLDAARLWDRAAEREKPGRQRTEYEENATRDRELAEGASAG